MVTSTRNTPIKQLCSYCRKSGHVQATCPAFLRQQRLERRKIAAEANTPPESPSIKPSQQSHDVEAPSTLPTVHTSNKKRRTGKTGKSGEDQSTTLHFHEKSPVINNASLGSEMITEEEETPQEALVIADTASIPTDVVVESEDESSSNLETVVEDQRKRSKIASPPKRTPETVQNNTNQCTSITREDTSTIVHQEKSKRARQCGLCGQSGHDRRNCPSKKKSTNQENNSPQSAGGASRPGNNAGILCEDVETIQEETVRETVTRNPTPVPQTVDPVLIILDPSRILYLCFDLETTGFSRTNDSIIEIAATLLDAEGIPIEDGCFHSYVKPQDKKISATIELLRGISNDTIKDAPTFDFVGASFVQFLNDKTIIDNDNVTIHQQPPPIICFVAHNGKKFDVPFLVTQMVKFRIPTWVEFVTVNTVYQIDTLYLAKGVVRKKNPIHIPNNYRLEGLFEYISGERISNAHQAQADVKALGTIFRYKFFWEERLDYVIPLFDGAILNVEEDSNTDTEELLEEEAEATNNATDDDDSIDEQVDNQPSDTRMGWRIGGSFNGTNAEESFNNFYRQRETRQTIPTVNRTGLQCSENSVNTPAKAWRQIFTAAFLRKIVGYTNEYGEAKCKHWKDITVSDLMEFISVLFIAGIQRRNDPPHRWFSDDIIDAAPVIKSIMSGRKFHLILRYLHVCSIEGEPQRNDPAYNPAYKINEMKDYMEDRYKRLFVPGQALSMDESLIRAFGRIKFKVRIITKSARYGIKIYVITDAATAFVLRIIVYTGQSTYDEYNNKQPASGKTVEVVKRLCRDFVGSHQTVYVNWFYMSVDLMRQLESMQLYITGTVMQN